MLLAIVLAMATAPADRAASQSGGERVRPPAVAGRFYPDNPATLKAALDAFMHDAVPPRGPRPIALVAPHAGYIFSGAIAADAYQQAKGHPPDLVVILGTNHTTAGFDGVSIYPPGAYQTPLGRAKIAADVAQALIDADPAFTFDPRVHEREHSVEVQVPFVQHLFPEARIVALVIGHPDLERCTRLGKTLAELLRDRNALIIASSDLSHYPAYDDAVKVDRALLDSITTLDPARVVTTISDLEHRGTPGLSTCACGEGPILTAMVAAKALGASEGLIISYANSGDTALGNRSRVVGYGAVMLAAGAGESRRQVPGDAGAAAAGGERDAGNATTSPRTGGIDDALTDDDRRALLEFARDSIRRYLTTETVPLARGFSSVAEQPCGAFVTLEKDGMLRGCTGNLTAERPLAQTVGATALRAAFSDRRFPPVTLVEVSELEIEISVLTPVAPASGVEAIVLGRDGVVLRKGDASAVYLPKVAIDRGWTRDEMLDHLCEKAGLEASCWHEGATFSTFQAIIFSERDFASPVAPQS